MGPSIGHQLPVRHQQYSVGEGDGQVQVVGDEEHGLRWAKAQSFVIRPSSYVVPVSNAIPNFNSHDIFHEVRVVGVILASAGFVHDQDARVHGEHAGDADA